MTLEQLIRLERANQLGQTEPLPKAEFQGQKGISLPGPHGMNRLSSPPRRLKWTWWMILPLLGCSYIIGGIGMVLFSIRSQQAKEAASPVRESLRQISVEGPKKQTLFAEPIPNEK
jgi:hypothetical protein